MEVIFYYAILVTAFFVGWLLAWLCKDELVSDRKWLKYTAIVAFIALIGDILIYRNLAVRFSILYLIIILFIMLYLGKNKRFMK